MEINKMSKYKCYINRQMINWYLETKPSLHDLENELEYQKINISTNDFIKFLKNCRRY